MPMQRLTVLEIDQANILMGVYRVCDKSLYVVETIPEIMLYIENILSTVSKETCLVSGIVRDVRECTPVGTLRKIGKQWCNFSHFPT